MTEAEEITGTFNPLYGFIGYQKIPRLSRDCVVTEKIDGTNAQIYQDIEEKGVLWVGSRNRWIGRISPSGEVEEMGSDNFGFRAWAAANHEQLRWLGYGRHFGEWWGQGIQRSYGLTEKRFSLFNPKYQDNLPPCCRVVPVLYTGIFETGRIRSVLEELAQTGSQAAPGFKDPEGIVIYHEGGGYLFKKTIKDDEKHKGEI